MRAEFPVRPVLFPILVILAAFAGVTVPSASRGGSPEPPHVSVTRAPRVSHSSAAAAPVVTLPQDRFSQARILARLCDAFGPSWTGCENPTDATSLSLDDIATAASPASREKAYVSFILATVPDYVDSNTAWMADEILGAMQAAVGHDGYVLDRFDLPEVPRVSPSDAGEGTSQSGGGAHDADTEADRKSPATPRRLHETEPGILIFRADDAWLVILTALETATSGLHVSAFDSAARFIADWQRAQHAEPELRIMGPTFSGSMHVMVDSLSRLSAEACIRQVHVVSGSATRDENAADFAGFCHRANLGDDACTYASAMHPNRQTLYGLYRQLQRMHPSWLPGRVALLQEANTTYGQSFGTPGLAHVQVAGTPM